MLGSLAAGNILLADRAYDSDALRCPSGFHHRQRGARWLRGAGAASAARAAEQHAMGMGAFAAFTGARNHKVPLDLG
jgi:hypothetical protein